MLIFTVKYGTKIYFISMAEGFWCPLNIAPKVMPHWSYSNPGPN